MEVDLHRHVIGTTVDGASAWSSLASRSQTLKIDSIAVQIPDLATTLTIVALHAAHHGVGMPKRMSDLNQAVASTDIAAWREALIVADELGARESFAAGLQLVAEGRHVCESLGLAKPSSAAIRLRAQSAPRSAWVLADFSALDTRTKVSAMVKTMLPRRKEMLYRAWTRKLAAHRWLLPSALLVWWARLGYELPSAMRWYWRDRRAHKITLS